MRQRSSLAHELGHVVFEVWTEAPVTRRSHEEIRADVFARHLLIPAEGLRHHLGDPGSRGIDEPALSAIVERFLVSPALAAIALAGAGFIDTSTKESWMLLRTRHLATRFGWSDYYAGLQDEANRPRPPRRLLDRALRGYILGAVSAETLASLRGIPVDQVVAELEAAGIRPEEQEPWAGPAALPRLDVDLTDLPSLDEDVESDT